MPMTPRHARTRLIGEAAHAKLRRSQLLTREAPLHVNVPRADITKLVEVPLRPVGHPALLRQPSGFEGSVPVGVYRQANDPPITKGPDVEEAVPHLGVGPSHPPAIADDVDNPPLVRVDHLFDLDLVSVERFPVLAPSFLCR